jgi:ATP-dependent exoDNAse (exonuclease V) alpha subunit
MAKKQSHAESKQLMVVPAHDHIRGRRLNRQERRAILKREKGKAEINREERAGLMNRLLIFVGMKVMVTFNLNTSLDIANGARGVITRIVLDSRETPSSEPIVELKYPPACVIVKLDGLEEGEIPILPMEKKYQFTLHGVDKSVTRVQLPMTPAYAFTDYRSQGQTLKRCYIDLGKVHRRLTPFNVYVALSRARGWADIRLIRDFDDRLFTQHPSEYLREEDARLDALDKETRA